MREFTYRADGIVFGKDISADQAFDFGRHRLTFLYQAEEGKIVHLHHIFIADFYNTGMAFQLFDIVEQFFGFVSGGLRIEHEFHIAALQVGHIVHDPGQDIFGIILFL